MIRVEDHGLAYYQFPALCAEPGLRHGFFTRLGGVSQPPYASMNVGASVGDDPGAVGVNRERCFAALGFSGSRVVTPHQVHGTAVVRVGAADGGRTLEATDGLITDERGVALFLRFADCVPIVLWDRERPAVGLVHAGWRGTLAGIAREGVAAMQAHFGSVLSRLWAGIGPAIGPCCYEVAPELAASFEERFGARVVSRPDAGNPRVDLAEANALALEAAGVAVVERARLCTACHADEFFSHRREEGRTGRFAVLIGLAG